MFSNLQMKYYGRSVVVVRTPSSVMFPVRALARQLGCVVLTLWAMINIFVTYNHAPAPIVMLQSETDITHNASHVTNYAKRTAMKVLAKVKPVLERRFPQCIIVGTVDSGADDLFSYMKMNPEVRAPYGETNFFHQYNDRGLQWYRRQMPRSLPSHVTVEMSVRYFERPEVPERVRAMNTSVKLVVVVLPPVDRTVAHWLRRCRYVSIL